MSPSEYHSRRSSDRPMRWHGGRAGAETLGYAAEGSPRVAGCRIPPRPPPNGSGSRVRVRVTPPNTAGSPASQPAPRPAPAAGAPDASPIGEDPRSLRRRIPAARALARDAKPNPRQVLSARDSTQGESRRTNWAIAAAKISMSRIAIAADVPGRTSAILAGGVHGARIRRQAPWLREARARRPTRRAGRAPPRPIAGPARARADRTSPRRARARRAWHPRTW